MNQIFQFKQFSVRQNLSAMKVGTDGVLLGAWANVHDAKTILDIGTGTGLLALMCAQRNQNTSIIAIDIDIDAIEEAKYNFSQSPWAERLHVFHHSLQEFSTTSKEKFGHIICNPPFFEQNDQLQGSRELARQHKQLSLNELATAISNLLENNGSASLVYPYEQRDALIQAFKTVGLHLQRKTEVHGRTGIPPKRVLMSFGFQEIDPEVNQLSIELSKRHEYSPEYITLTKEFYLKM